MKENDIEFKIENPEISTEKLKRDWDSEIGRAILGNRVSPQINK